MAVRLLCVDHLKGRLHELEAVFKHAGDFLLRVEDSGEKGLQCAFNWRPHLMIVGQDLTGISGREVCRVVKADPRTRHIPIVAVSEAVPEGDIIETLRAGADEYVLLPCSPDQLLWRIRAVLRRFERVGELPKETLRAGPLLLVADERTAYVRGHEVDLRKKEFELLETLVRSPGKVLTRRFLLESIWGYDSAVSTRTVDIHVARLRKKLGPAGRKLIVAVHGVGYKLRRARLPHL